MLNHLLRLAIHITGADAAVLALRDPHAVFAVGLDADCVSAKDALALARQPHTEEAIPLPGCVPHLYVTASYPIITPGGADLGALLSCESAPTHAPSPQATETSEALSAVTSTAADVIAQHATQAADDRARWHSLAERYDAPILITVGDTIAFANEAARHTFHMLGADTLVGISLFDLVDEHYHAALRQRHAELQQGGPLSSTTYELLRADGSLMRFESASTPIVYGGVAAAQIIARDVTGEYERAKREHFKATLLDTVQQAVIAVEVDGTTTYWNEAANTLFGYDSSEMVGRNVFETAASEPLRLHGHEVFAAMREGKPWSGEFEVQRKDGSLVWLHLTLTPVVDETGWVTSIICVAGDISARKRSEIAVREREAWLDTILEHAPLIFFVLDGEGQVLLSRGSGLHALGLEPDELVGISAIDACADSPEAADHIRRVLKSEGTVSHESQLRGRWYRSWYNSVKGDTDEITRVVGLAMDVTEQQDTNALVRRQHSLLYQSQQHLGTWVYDIRADVLWWSEEVYRIHEVSRGFTPTAGEAIGFYAPTSRPVIRAAFERCMSEGDAFDLELELQTSQGRRRWVQALGSPIYEGEEIVEVAGTFLDITARKTNELRLRQSRARLEEAQRIAQVGSWTREIGSDEIVVSTEMRRIFGLPPDAPATVERLVSAIHPDDRAAVLDDKDSLDRGEGQMNTYRILHPDGRIRVVRRMAETERDTEGNPVRVHGTVRDITDQVRREAELRLRDRAINATSVGVIISDAREPGMPLTFCNDAFERITGYTREESTGRNCRFLQRRGDGTMDDDQPHLTVLRDAIARGLPCSGTLRNYHKDGTLFWNRLSVSPVRDEDGVVTHFIGIQENVTEQIENEIVLRQAKRKAEEMNQLKDTFLTNLSHEIRTPLTVIRGYSEILLDVVPETERDLVHLLREGGNRLFDTFTTLLELARLESGTREIRCTAFDVRGVAHDVVKDHQATAHAKDLALSVEEPETAILALTDRDAVRTIIHQIVSNAVKFTSSGFIRVGVASEPDVFVVTVQDTGVGVSPDEQGSIFEAFRQASAGANRAYEGTGLGLGVARDLADMLGGRITVESELGVGSLFTVTLPLRLA